MVGVHLWTPPILVAAALCLSVPVAFGFAGTAVVRGLDRLPLPVQLLLPALGAIPYALVTFAARAFQPHFFLLYALMPVVLVYLLWHARQADPQQLGNWRDFVVLVLLGVIVEFRILEHAWPARLGGFNRILLLDTGLYGFFVVRQLSNIGFDLRPRLADWKFGLRELLFYAPVAIALGLWLGFLHWQRVIPSAGRFATAWISIFVFVALLEETYFRGWWQNLLERRLGSNGALVVTAVLFGLSHFNKGATHFNWRYVVLASLAGIFYGRAWRAQYRLFASAITHSLVDTIWLLWLR